VHLQLIASHFYEIPKEHLDCTRPSAGSSKLPSASAAGRQASGSRRRSSSSSSGPLSRCCPETRRG
jgi:hypothetical protein